MAEETGAAKSPCRADRPIVAVDIGNARIKLGWFDPPDTAALIGRRPETRADQARPLPEAHNSSPEPTGVLPVPQRTWTIDGTRPEFEPPADWLGTDALLGVTWWIGSVNRRSTTVLLDWLRAARPQDRIVLLGSSDLPLTCRLPEPDRIGVDRLLDAVAANALRPPGCPAVVVDVGTAITVDLVGPEGTYCGGAIVPGIAMSARALHQFTDLLPLVDMNELHRPPPAVGTSTVGAIHSGLYWCVVGTIRELVARMTSELQLSSEGEEAVVPQVYLTGGAGAAVAGLLGPGARLVPHLTLAGIALTARAHTARWLPKKPPGQSAW